MASELPVREVFSRESVPNTRALTMPLGRGSADSGVGVGVGVALGVGVRLGLADAVVGELVVDAAEHAVSAPTTPAIVALSSVLREGVMGAY